MRVLLRRALELFCLLLLLRVHVLEELEAFGRIDDLLDLLFCAGLWRLLENPRELGYSDLGDK